MPDASYLLEFAGIAVYPMASHEHRFRVAYPVRAVEDECADVERLLQTRGLTGPACREVRS